jgi:hypothetical protein
MAKEVTNGRLAETARANAIQPMGRRDVIFMVG